MKRTLPVLFPLVLIFTLGMLPVNSQSQIEEVKMLFKDGMYNTFDDFLIGVPTDTITSWTMKIGSDTLSNRFFDEKTGKRLKNVFAFIKNGDIYLKIKDMLKNVETGDKGQLKDDGNYHLKAIMIGDKYLYFEDYFTSKGAAIWGGAIAASIARRRKGLIYDIDYQNFNLFKNAKDFETFIKNRHPAMVPHLENLDGTTRKKNVEDINTVREIMKEVING